MHSLRSMDTPKKKGRGSTNVDPDEEAELGLYLSPEKEIAIPSMLVLSALRKASTDFKAKGKGKKTFKDYVFSDIQINPQWIRVSPDKWITDIQYVVVGRGRVPRARPRFDEWGCEFDITIVNDDIWTGSQLRDVLESAGTYKGLCDFRPLYGTFEVTSFTDSKGKEV